MESKKGIIQFIAIALMIGAVLAGLFIWDYFQDKKEENNPATTTTTTTIAWKVIEYKSLNRSCTSNANCTAYYSGLGLDLNVTCRNNICNQMIIK